MVSKIILVYDLEELDYVKDLVTNVSDFKIFSFNYGAHIALEKNNIKHEIADVYLTENERLEIYDFVASRRNWEKKLVNIKDLEYENVNLLSIFDTNELHTFLIINLINFIIIKKIIDNEKPDKIFSSGALEESARVFSQIMNIELVKIGKKFLDNMMWDRIPFKMNIGKFPISLTLSRNSYYKIKNIIEQVVCNTFNLWLERTKNNHILLVEFDPEKFNELLIEFKKKKITVILFNKRRIAISSTKSIRSILNGNCKIVNFQKILKNYKNTELDFLAEQYRIRLSEIFQDDKVLSELFSYQNLPFWESIKKSFVEMFLRRLKEQLSTLYVTKQLLENTHISAILTLNEIGESEKAILNFNKKNIPSILLEHGFANFTHEISRYDIVGTYSDFTDRIALWSDEKKNYLINEHKVDSKRIFVIGSPRHDQFFKIKRKQAGLNEFTLLLAPVATNEIQGQADTKLHIMTEKVIREIYSIIKQMKNVKMIVKLHPAQLRHNDDLKTLFQNIDPKIPVYLWSPVMDKINSCDAVVIISPQGFGTSTMILESLILEKPVMNVVVDEKIFPFEHVNYNAILTVTPNSDIKYYLNLILFDEKYRNTLIKNGQHFLKDYLFNHGVASKDLVNTVLKISNSNFK